MLPALSGLSRTRTAPTGYEKVRLWFHLIRTAQCFSSLVVGGLVGSFAYWLRHDGFGVTWTFSILLFTSFATVACLFVTIIFHCLSGLSPRLSLVLNAAMMGLWGLGFSMLTYWSWFTLTNNCDTRHWKHERGMDVCRDYKVLFTFGLTGTLSTAAALALDLHINRMVNRFGTHTRLHDDRKFSNRSVLDLPNGLYGNTAYAHSTVSLDNYASRSSDVCDMPRSTFGGQPHQGPSKALLSVPSHSRSHSNARSAGHSRSGSYSRPSSPGLDLSPGNAGAQPDHAFGQPPQALV